ncbi:MAG TPA: hypothetical protein VNQ76_14390 [Planctomicrobium sp.]|nr:hypothetical protein [Planctomicrobium sp.]
MRFSILSIIITTISLLPSSSIFGDEPASLRIATFKVDATPPIGSPVAYAPTRKIEDPLSARGIVLLGAGKPIVLCAVDWIGIGNDGNLIFREKLAEAAGTTRDRVAVHTLHQHDGPRCDFRAEELMASQGLGGERYDSAFCRHVIESAAQAIRDVMPQAKPVTHLGVGKAIVDKVASNRRILGPDGKVALVRYSSGAKNPASREAPEGLIDPELKLISFWNGDQPVASLTYYATHPQSYYGKGDVTSEFIGLARARREQALPEIAHIHFNGAGGNVTAGKYNDGSPEMRVTLTDRMEAGMKQAWESTVKSPLTSDQVSWNVAVVHVPVSRHLDYDSLKTKLVAKSGEAQLYAPKISWAERDEGGGVPIDLTCLKLGNVSILHMPGELFIEYQLAAQKMAPDSTVCMAAYGDYGPCYIGTEISYTQGGYETSPTASLVTPQVEQVLMNGIEKLLK